MHPDATGDGTLAALRRGDLAGAREVRIQEPLDVFPRELFGLADTLEVLDLAGTGLDSLPHDMGRFTCLSALFCSNNRFARLPPSLGECGVLSQVAFRNAGLREVPGEALSPRLRWLTLTDNAIASLPLALGERPALQKLLLAGNRLDTLPESLMGAPNLELIRLSANLFAEVPGWLPRLPRLAWAAWAGNPAERAPPSPDAVSVPWHQLAVGAPLGEGASGRVHAVTWEDGVETRCVAVKLFKGAMTSDGLPEREMAACLAAGAHPHLAGALGRVVAHPAGVEGLVMPLLPAGWRALAGPPSRTSCSRDVFDPMLELEPDAALRIARGIAAAAAHLHARGLSHGDLYAHNVLWDGAAGEAVLSDFGAASTLPPGEVGTRWRQVEVRAFGILLGELLDRCVGLDQFRTLERACTGSDMAARPEMAEVASRLAD